MKSDFAWLVLCLMAGLASFGLACASGDDDDDSGGASGDDDLTDDDSADDDVADDDTDDDDTADDDTVDDDTVDDDSTDDDADDDTSDDDTSDDDTSDDDTADDDAECHVSFDGATGKGVSEGNLALTDDYTIETWTMIDALPLVDEGNLVSSLSWDGSNFPHGFVFLISKTTGRTRMCIGRDLAWTLTCVESVASLSTGVWHHVAATVSSGTYCLFIDGTPDNCVTPAHTIFPDAAGPVQLGFNPWDAYKLDGAIDEVHVSSVVRYTSAFTPQSVFTEDADSEALYHFDECSGTTAFDAAAHGNDIDLAGAFAWGVDS